LREILLSLWYKTMNEFLYAVGAALLCTGIIVPLASPAKKRRGVGYILSIIFIVTGMALMNGIIP